MKDGITAGDIEIRQPIHFPAHLLALFYYRFCSLKRHLNQVGMSLGKYITMLATLVAAIGYMPLKCEIFHIASRK